MFYSLTRIWVSLVLCHVIMSTRMHKATVIMKCTLPGVLFSLSPTTGYIWVIILVAALRSERLENIIRNPTVVIIAPGRVTPHSHILGKSPVRRARADRPWRSSNCGDVGDRCPDRYRRIPVQQAFSLPNPGWVIGRIVRWWYLR